MNTALAAPWWKRQLANAILWCVKRGPLWLRREFALAYVDVMADKFYEKNLAPLVKKRGSN